jgi:hypothetical protein
MLRTSFHPTIAHLGMIATEWRLSTQSGHCIVSDCKGEKRAMTLAEHDAQLRAE